ncbi:MAG: signal peptide peptidase SppA [Planctomycetales bacterium]|nr:signal peptide peptidase SppA [Planctomycetales bacterium]
MPRTPGICYLLVLVAGLAAPSIALAQAPSTEPNAAEPKAVQDNSAEPKSAGESSKKSKPSLIPVFSLDRPLLESPVVDDPLFGSVGAETLNSLVARLEKARDDDQVKAVLVLVGQGSLGAGQIEEVRRALQDIRDAGKPVYAHADSLSFSKLALLSAASRVSVAPVGDLFITGLYGSQPHIRGLLDKIHVTPDFITCGEYKSAGEMFMRSEPSPEAERMYDWLFDSLFDNSVGMIAEGREKTREEVRQWIDHGLYSAEKAAELGIIDAAEYRADLVKQIKLQHGEKLKFDKRYGKKSTGQIDFSNPFAMFKIWAEILRGPAKPSDKTAVALIYVDGAIIPGKPEPSPFGSSGMAYSDPIRRALDKAAEDDSVKAVVLRVNSPGGSAVASEIILQATRRVAAKKPILVSMGDVAGSGGYYVSCGAETIFADAGTVTASIGVVAGKLATEEMWNSIGITWHPIARGKNSGMLQSRQIFTDEQRDNLQCWMDEVYEVFKGHVVAIRGERLTKPIDEIAGGRVFTGRQALELGLVDRIGTLDDAIKAAAKRAEIDEYEVRVIPRPKNFIEVLMSDMTGAGDDDQRIQLGAGLSQTSFLWQAVAPVLGRLEPQQTESLRRMLVQLEILQQERLSLTMPEITVGY